MLNIERIFTDLSPQAFEQLALEIFRFQAQAVVPYKQFLSYLNIDADRVKALEDIPFLPIQFFKSHKINSKASSEATFLSSGTTTSIQSKHYIYSLAVYYTQLDASFKHFYGDFEDFVIFPLLPAYAERKGSSLIAMVDYWMSKTKQEKKEYYLYNHKALAEDLKLALQSDKKIILIGVSFALLDFAEAFSIDLSSVIIIETGGMKGRRKELTRDELHQNLKNSFKTDNIQSEYGMTELLSQAYSKRNGLFTTPPWMRVLLRDPADPLNFVDNGKSGGINVIDLANIYSCSFIATDDLGRYKSNLEFEILGRFDSSDVRGCNLMVAED